MVARTAISADALEGRIATFLHQHSLEKVVGNVARNNIWESEPRIQELELEVRRTYQACELVVAGKSVPAIARQYHLPVPKVSNWRYKDCIPDILESHAVPLTPDSKTKQRLSFAYLLGVYCKTRSKSPSRLKLGKKPFHARISDPVARERVLRSGRVFLGEDFQEEGVTVYYPNHTFARVLNYCVHNEFESYVSMDQERIAYLRGFFDASCLNVIKRKKGNLYYKIQRGNEALLTVFAKVMFELGIFPRVSKSDNTLYVECFHDLNGLQNLEIDSNPENRAKVASALLELSPQNHTLKTYYAVRNAVRRRLEQGSFESWEKLASELKGPCRETIRGWTTDIVEEYNPGLAYEKVTPKMVARHRELTELLGIPNVFEEEGSYARIGENVFFNIDGEVYFIPSGVQQLYCTQARAQSIDDHLEILSDQLRKNLKGGIDVSVKMKIEPDGAITALETRYLYQDNLQFEVEGEVIIITNSALYDYFIAYGLELAPLTPDDITFLREEYQSNGGGDLTFRMGAKGVVEGIDLKGVKGGNRWDMQKNYIGVRGDSSNLLSVFGFVPPRY